MSDISVTSMDPNFRGVAFNGPFAPIAPEEKASLKKPWYRRKEYFTEGWLDPLVWRAGVVEGVGAFCIVYLLAQFGMSLMNYGIVQTGGYIGAFCWALLTVLVYTLAPVTGAQMNVMVTFTMVICGLCPLPRGVIYMFFQMSGAAVAGGLMVLGWGLERTLEHQGTGCFYDPSLLTGGQVLVMEIAADFILLFLLFGVALDPRSFQAYGPSLAPPLVGVCFGMVAMVNSATAPGYGGANLNPTKCFGFAVATGNFSTQWIWWSGAAVGGLLQAILYNLQPPWGVPDDEISSEKPREV